MSDLDESGDKDAESGAKNGAGNGAGKVQAWNPTARACGVSTVS